MADSVDWGQGTVKRSVILLWVFFSLLAISFSGNNVLAAILIAAAGGVIIGASIFFWFRRGR
jgi:hypothetical protein